MKQQRKQYNNSGSKKASPIKNKEEVQASNDEHIDQDFPGFPHPPSEKKIIDPQGSKDRSMAGLSTKRTTPKNKKKTGEKAPLRGELEVRSSKKKRRK